LISSKKIISIEIFYFFLINKREGQSLKEDLLNFEEKEKIKMENLKLRLIY
jgi:hypothetical protein